MARSDYSSGRATGLSGTIGRVDWWWDVERHRQLEELELFFSLFCLVLTTPEPVTQRDIDIALGLDSPE